MYHGFRSLFVSILLAFGMTACNNQTDSFVQRISNAELITVNQNRTIFNTSIARVIADEANKENIDLYKILSDRRSDSGLSKRILFVLAASHNLELIDSIQSGGLKLEPSEQQLLFQWCQTMSPPGKTQQYKSELAKILSQKMNE